MFLFFRTLRKLLTADNRLVEGFLAEKSYMNGNTIGIVRLAGIYRSYGCATAAIPDFGRRALADVKEDALFFVVYKLCIQPLSTKAPTAFNYRNFDAVASVPGAEWRTGNFGIGTAAACRDKFSA